MIKTGVRVFGVRPEVVLALIIARDVCVQHGVDFVVTSVMEGVHSRASIHYTGGAADLRRPTQQALAEAVVADMKERLGDDFDVILEIDHIHVEFQPKAPY